MTDQTFPQGPAFIHHTYSATLKIFAVNDTASPAASGYITPGDLVTAILAGATIPSAGTGLPGINGAASAGSAATYSRSDHIHPTDTSLLPKAGGTMTGALVAQAGVSVTGGTATDTLTATGAVTSPTHAAGTAAGSSADVTLQSTAGTPRWISFLSGALMRWKIGLAGATEGGSNAGGDLVFNRYNDTGTLIGAALSITRASGLVTVAGDPTAALGVATKQYVDAIAVAAGTTTPSTATPLVNSGTGAVGTSAQFSRGDHVHPVDSSRASAANTAMTGAATITDATSGFSVTLTVSAASSTAGANIRLVGNGATTPNKTMRVSGGSFQLVNHAYSNVLLSIDDAGNSTLAGTLSSGLHTIVDATTSGANSTLLLNGTSNTSIGAQVQLSGNGATTPNKYIRAKDGSLFILSNSGSPILTMTDAGAASLVSGSTTGAWSVGTTLTVAGSITSPASMSITGLSAGIDLGAKATANTPFLDFNSSGYSNDYDVRLLASGGSNATLGGGTLTVQAATTVFSVATTAIPAPTADTVLRIAGANGVSARMLTDTFGIACSTSLRRANGTALAPSALAANDLIGTLSWQGYGATAYAGTRASVAGAAAAAWTDTSQGTYVYVATTTVGATSAFERMRVTDSGRVLIGTTTDDGANLLQVAGTVAAADLNIAGSGAIAGAWTATTPTPAAYSGTLTTASATLRYRKLARTVFFEASIVITTNGTAAGYLTLPLPFVSAVAAVVAGRETVATGKACIASVVAGATQLNISFYDNTYPGANGATVVLSGVYEATT